ncbi:VWA domain-containing protein [Neobacillus sp. OS1-2]|uniref:VWA domain-containing protein n=1 Tax=Neobacillus sp. OS1-2 TaxID=3070680 RepID=UPI0027E07F92|nr:VWA domain-containing protein [Neobacillus sp. OS1-2]WML40729.1 VWA domain-containing protein [Neobacillus sp. OS1-2]
MRKISAMFGIIIFFILLGMGNSVSADSAPKVDFSVSPSQSVIVKPQGENAQGSLNVHLMPSGVSTSANRDPIDVVFIFDKSGSMNESGKNPKKFQSAKDAMTEAVSFFKKNAGPRDRFSFISFSSDVEQVVNFSPTTVNAGLDLINQTVKDLKAEGGTNYTQSFEKAINLLDGSQNNKYIIFMTDGEPTFSIYNEPITYTKKIQTGTKESCFWFICKDEPIYETKQVTENIPVHYEMYGTGSNMSNKVYYEINGTKTSKNISNTQAINSIKNHGISMANKLAEKNIKLFSIGFGSDSEVDMSYLRELSSKTGVTARQANQDNISSIFQDISKDIATPAIDAEVKIDLSKFNGKVNLLEGSDARLEGNVVILKANFSFPIGQSVNQPIDVSLPFSFTDITTYTFDNIKLTYKNLNGQTIPLSHEPVSIDVKADAPSSFKGAMNLSGVTNTVDNLIKVSNVSQTTNQFTVSYSLSPYGLVNNQVSGLLSNLKLIQPLPDGVSIYPTAGVKSITYNGKPAAQIDLTQTVNYKSGIFTPSQVTASLKLQADWALSNTKMPTAILQYKDSRFTQSQETTIPASNQIINMKVRLNEFPSNVYDGDALGIITKMNDSTKNIISQTEFPNDYSLKNKPIKDMTFVNGSLNKTIEVTYYDGEKVLVYLVPDFELIGKESGNSYNSGAITNEFVDVKLSKTVAGKDVKYYYSSNPQNPIWTEFNPSDSIPLKTAGINTVQIKAIGGFALDNLIVEKTITIQRKITSITVDPASIEVEVGSSMSFIVNLLPIDATNKDLEITVIKPEIAVMTDSNRILGVSEGNTELLIKTKDGSDLSVRVPVHVTDPYIPLKEVKFKKAVFKIQPGEKIAIDNLLIFNPTNATKKAISSVTTSFSDKVEVKNENGKWYIIGKNIGYSTVKATAEEQKDGSKPKDSALFEVTNDDSANTDNGTTGEGRW